MNQITALKEIDKRKVSIEIDGEYAGFLYHGEMRRLKIVSGKELTEQELDELNDVIYKRAKERYLYIIERTEKTSKEIKEKLVLNGYPEKVAMRVISFLTKYGFVNDEDYARRYMQYKSSKRSLRQIRMELMRKGISKDVLSSIEEDMKIDESETIRILARKKYRSLDSLDETEKRKLIRYLLGKGFSYEKIKDALTFGI